MASSRKRVRYNFDVTFGSQEEKDAFLDRLKSVRQLLTPPDCPTVDNNRLFKAMFDAVEENHQQDPSASGVTDHEQSTKSFLRNNGELHMLYSIVMAIDWEMCENINK